MYLMLLMQFLENKVAVELTRSGFVEAQEVVCVAQSSPHSILCPCFSFFWDDLHLLSHYYYFCG